MSRTKLPGPGVVGAPADDQHLVAAALHVRGCKCESHTPAYLDKAARGEALLAAVPEVTNEPHDAPPAP